MIELSFLSGIYLFGVLENFSTANHNRFAHFLPVLSKVVIVLNHEKSNGGRTVSCSNSGIFFRYRENYHITLPARRVERQAVSDFY